MWSIFEAYSSPIGKTIQNKLTDYWNQQPETIPEPKTEPKTPPSKKKPTPPATKVGKAPEQLKTTTRTTTETTTITLGTPPYLTIKEYVDMWDKIKEFNKRNKKMPDPVDTPKGKVTHKDYTAMYNLLKKWEKTHKRNPDMIGPYK